MQLQRLGRGLSRGLLCGVLLHAPVLANQNAAPGQICIACFDFQSLDGTMVARTWNHSIIRYSLSGGRSSQVVGVIQPILAEMTKYTSISFIEADEGAASQLLFVVDSDAFKKVVAGDETLRLPSNDRVASLLRTMVRRSEAESQDCTAVHLDDARANTQGGFFIVNGDHPSCIERYMKGIMGLRALAESDHDDLRNLCFLYTARRLALRSQSALLQYLASNPNVCSAPLNS